MIGVKKKINNVRTTLLITMSKELGVIKKTSKTMINRRTLTKAEEDFSAQNDQVISLKTEIFSGENIAGEVSQSMLGEGINRRNSNRLTVPSVKNSFNSIFYDSESSVCSIDSKEISALNELPNNIIRKSAIGQKKIEYFKETTLNKLKEENPSASPKKSNKVIVEETVEYINTDMGFFKSEKTKQRTETGFKFLQKLCRKIKKRKTKIKKSNTKSSLLEGMKEILSLKDNVNLEDISEKTSNKESTFSRQNSNFVVMLNGEAITENKSNTKNSNPERSTKKKATFSFSLNNNTLEMSNIKQSTSNKMLNTLKVEKPNKSDKLNNSFQHSKKSDSEFSITLNSCK